jgi:hypothetical protein
MFQQLGVEVLGVVENMSYFIGDDGKEYDIFGRGGAEQMAQRLGLPFLGAIPINMAFVPTSRHHPKRAHPQWRRPDGACPRRAMVNSLPDCTARGQTSCMF